MKQRNKVCVFSSVHPPTNTRVFHKEAKSLVKAGYDVVMVAPHNKAETVDGVRIKPIPVIKNKLKRMLLSAPRAFAAALGEDADIYHFHDPELVPYGLLMRLMGKKVVYDVHEYYRLKLMGNRKLPGFIRGVLARSFDLVENAASRFFSGVITVDSFIARKFGGRAVVVSNFPYKPVEPVRREKGKGGVFTCVYVGGLSRDRGFFRMVEAIGRVGCEARLLLAGFGPESFRLMAASYKGSDRVEWLGYRKWPEVMGILSSSDLGLLLLQPTPSYRETGEGIAKLFEYMMNGVPVLCSDFPSMRRIVEKEECGLTVDPTDPRAIAEKITYMANNPGLREKMGGNGMRAVSRKYNWEEEEKKMLALYDRILGAGTCRP